MMFNHDSYCRLISKAGYGQILTSLDPSDFNPICLPYILGEKVNHSYIVGGDGCTQSPDIDIGYSMGTGGFGDNDYLVLIAEIRLFANLHTPKYHVVVGDVSGNDKVNYVKEKLTASLASKFEYSLPSNVDTKEQDHWMPNEGDIKNIISLNKG